MAFVMVMTGNAWAQNANIIIPTRTGTDNLSWTFQMPTGKCVLHTTWKQDAGLAYAKSDTSVYLGDPFSGQELTNPHNVPVTYSIVPKANTTTGNEINASTGEVTLHGVGIDTVKAIFAGNDTLQADTAYYIIDVRTAAYYYTLTLIPADHGTVTLTGATGSSPYSIAPNTEITLTASAHDDYHFVKWTDDNSTENPRTVTITKDSTFSAVFVINTVRLDSVRTTWTVQVDGVAKTVTDYVANPTANDTMGYVLIPKNADVVITPSTEQKELVSKLDLIPIGAINGKFSVGSNKQVYFSKGNLQATTDNGWDNWTFSFMEHQYSMVETEGQNVGADYANQNVVSLFGWGTSGYAHRDTCYQPNSTNKSFYNYYAYGDPQKSLFDESGKADWGYNAISNGGNTENSGWRTLTNKEWVWLLGPTYSNSSPDPGTNCRTSSTVNDVANARFAKANLFGTTRGLIIFPDNYNHPEGVAVPIGINDVTNEPTSWDVNTYTSADWAKMEAAGAVFLPAAGRRPTIRDYDDGCTVMNVGNTGCYWSSTDSTYLVQQVVFGYGNNFIVDGSALHSEGHSVRLVKMATVSASAQTDPYVPARNSDNSWAFKMPTSDLMLRTTWKQPCGLAFSKSDTTVYRGFTSTVQNPLTKPHNLTVTYSSSNNNVATVATDGTVTVKGVGHATITATTVGNNDYQACSASYTLTVVEPKKLTLVAHETTMGTVGIDPLSDGVIGDTATYNDNNTHYLVKPGTEVTIKAIAATHNHFVNWTNEGNAEYSSGVVTPTGTYPTTSTLTLNITGDTTATGNFAIDTYTITVDANDDNMGTVTGGNTYEHGAQVTLTATPATGYHFVNWTKAGTVVSTAASYGFTATAETAGDYIATFAINTYTVKVGGIPTSPNPYGFAKISICSQCQHVSYDENANVHKYTVYHGDNITIEATASEGHHFAAWEGYDSDVNPLQIVGVDRDYTINAYFEVNTYSVSASGEHGTVELGGDGLTTDGQHGKYGGPVTFTAIPDEGYYFVKWNDNNTDNPRTITVTKDTVLTATFAIANRLDSVRTTWTVGFDGVTKTVVSYGDAHPDYGYVMIPKNAQVVITPSTEDKPLVSKLELIIDPANVDLNTIPQHTGDNWTFEMPADNRVLRTTWKQDAGLAYAKSDTTVYLGEPFSGQELTNPHGIPVTYSIAHKTGTNSGNTINNNAGVVTINGAGIDTVKAIFAGNDTLLADTAMYIINAHTYYTLTLTAIGNGNVEILSSSGNKTIIPSSSISVEYCCTSMINEGCDSLFDGIISGNNKWCSEAQPKKVVVFKTTNAVQVSGYTLFTANDNATAHGRNPNSWVLKANLDGGDNWTTIDSVSNDATMQDVNYTAYDFEMDIPGTYRYFRFEVSEVDSGDILQLGELQLFSRGNTLPDGVTQGDTPDTYIVEYGTNVTVKAIPEAGYALLDWSDNHSVDAIRTVTVTSDTNLVATFGLLTPGLTPFGELTTYGGRFVRETGEIKGMPRITETGEFTKVSSREPTTIDLSAITEAFTAQNGDTLTGALDVEHHPVKISIAKGATVMLDDVTINGTHSMSYLWAGITCKGDATIILKDGTTNKVTGFNNEYPGIYVPMGSTLTIKGGTQGTDSLIVGSNGFAAGIGAGLNHKSCGNIIIQGGNIVATGDLYAAGIGGAYVSTCGDIEITGGNITAKGGVGAAGIGGGRGANCGDILISGGTIIATGGDDAAGIGGGGPIDINTDCGSITITSTVTSVTAKKSAQNPGPNSIGAGKGGDCGTVTIGNSTGAITTSPYTYQPTQP